MSQVIVWIIPQSEFVGQQMTDCTDALLRDMHAVSFGQQKSDGKPVPHCCRLDLPPHVGACRRKMCDACAVAIADETRNRMETLERRGSADDRAILILVGKPTIVDGFR